MEIQLLEKSKPFAHVKGIQVAQMIKSGIRQVLDTVVQCFANISLQVYGIHVAADA